MVAKTKRLGVNLVTSVIGTIVGLGVAFLLTPYLVSKLGKDVYSFYPMANNFISYFSIIVTALNALASRFITVKLVGGKPEESKEYFSSVFFANLLLTVIFVVPLTFIILFLDKFLNIPTNQVLEIKILFAFVFFAFLVNLVTSVFGAATFVRDRIDLKSYQHIFVYVIRVIGYIGLFLLFKPSIVFVGIVALSESIVNALISILYAKKLLPGYKISVKNVRKSAIKNLVTSGIWNSVNSLGSNLLSGMMVVLANILISADASGSISLTMTLVNLCTTLISMVVTVFYPRMTREFAKNGEKGLTSETILSQKILSFITSTPIIVLILLGEEFYSLWVPGEDAAYLQQISCICLIPYVFQTGMWTITQIFPVTNKLRVPALATLFFGVLTIVTTLIAFAFDKNLIIIPVVSTIFNILYCVVFVPIYASKLIHENYIKLVKPLIFGIFANAITFVACSLIKQFFAINSWLGLILLGGLFCVIGYILSGIVCLLSPIRDYLKNKKMGEIDCNEENY